MFQYWDNNTTDAMKSYEYSTVRSWLNNDFYNIAFNDQEKNIILDTVVNYNISDENDISSVTFEGSVLDKVFILDVNELIKYFEYSSTKIIELQDSILHNNNNIDCRVYAELTDYAKYNEYNDEIWGNKRQNFVLRTTKQPYKTGLVVALYPSRGDSIWHITGGGGLDLSGIRPAMWVSYDENNVYDSSLNGWNDGFYYKNGKILTNQWTPDGVYVNYNGIPVDIEKDKSEIDKNDVNINAWYRTKNGIWYYFEKDRETMKKGWHYDPRDNQVYYLDDNTGIMVTGWKEIDGDMYYFNEEHAVTPNWYYVESLDEWQSYGYDMKSYGSMFKDEETPDGRRVDKDGKLIS